jgi:gas vesicle protein
MEVDYFANNNTEELLGHFDHILDETGKTVDTIVDDTLIGINFAEIKGIADFILNISKKFVEEDKKNAIDLLQDLSSDVDHIKDNLTDISTTLDEIKSDPACTNDPTNICKDAIDTVTITIQPIIDAVTNYDEINNAISQINGTLNDEDLEKIKNLVGLVNSAEEVLRNFSSAFVNDYTKVIRDDVTEIMDDIKEEITNLTDELKKIDLNNATKDIGDQIETISGYTDIILYVTLVPAIILGIALLLSCCGLIIGN